MEGFTYTNIFETKGIEYIIIIIFLLSLIPFWIIVNRKTVSRPIITAIRNFSAAILNLPKGIYFSKNHTWVYLETNGEAATGIDDFLSLSVGTVKIKTFKKPGQAIKKGELMAELIAGEKKLNIISPISGEIIQTNQSVTDNQNWNRIEFYANTWFYKIKPSNWKAETSAFFLGDEAREWINNELMRLKDFLNVSTARYATEATPAVLQEGGEIIVNPLEGMQSEIWNDFQKEFLD